MKKFTRLTLLAALMFSLVLGLFAGSLAVNAEDKEDKKDDKEKKEESLILSDVPDALTAEEREANFVLYYPLGIKFKLVKDFSGPHLKARTEGMHGKDDDLIYMSRHYYFRPQAAIDLAKTIFEEEYEKDKDVYKKRIKEEVNTQDIPLWGIYNLREDKLPETEQELLETLQVENLKKVGEKDGIVQYLCVNGNHADALTEKDDIDAYNKAYKAMEDVILPSLQTFPAMKPYDSIPLVKDWKFEAETFDGKTIDQSIFKDADMTYVIYWTTWCPDCHHELEFLGKEKDFLKDNNIQVLCVVKDIPVEDKDEETLKTAKEFLKKSNTEDFIHVFDSVPLEDSMFKYCLNIPTCFFVDSEGNCLSVVYVEPDGTAFEKDALKLLDELKADKKD